MIPLAFGLDISLWLVASLYLDIANSVTAESNALKCQMSNRIQHYQSEISRQYSEYQEQWKNVLLKSKQTIFLK